MCDLDKVELWGKTTTSFVIVVGSLFVVVNRTSFYLIFGLVRLNSIPVKNFRKEIYSFRPIRMILISLEIRLYFMAKFSKIPQKMRNIKNKRILYQKI